MARSILKGKSTDIFLAILEGSPSNTVLIILADDVRIDKGLDIRYLREINICYISTVSYEDLFVLGIVEFNMEQRLGLSLVITIVYLGRVFTIVFYIESVYTLIPLNIADNGLGYPGKFGNVSLVDSGLDSKILLGRPLIIIRTGKLLGRSYNGLNGIPVFTFEAEAYIEGLSVRIYEGTVIVDSKYAETDNIADSGFISECDIDRGTRNDLVKTVDLLVFPGIPLRRSRLYCINLVIVGYIDGAYFL